MGVAKKCHEHARSLSHHVMTTIRIEDEEGAVNKLENNVATLERLAGHQLVREPHRVLA
jgi:hypothetical protein